MVGVHKCILTMTQSAVSETERVRIPAEHDGKPDHIVPQRASDEAQKKGRCLIAVELWSTCQGTRLGGDVTSNLD